MLAVEEWIAISYGRSMKYIGKVVKESDTMITANFLDRRADGDYQLKKNQEEVDKALFFLRNVNMVWKGVGRFQVLNEKEIMAKQAEHWRFCRLREEVINIRFVSKTSFYYAVVAFIYRFEFASS